MDALPGRNLPSSVYTLMICKWQIFTSATIDIWKIFALKFKYKNCFLFSYLFDIILQFKSTVWKLLTFRKDIEIDYFLLW